MITRHFVLAAVVSVKPISGKYSWTVHETPERADLEAQSSRAARRRGHHTRFLYRVNLYCKHFH